MLSLGLILVGVALIGVGAALLWRWQRLAADVARLSAQLGTTDEQAREARVAIAEAEGTFLTVEILNPFELAGDHSRIGASLAGVAPGLVRRRVYQTVASELREELQSRGVQAEVEVHRGDA